MPPSQGAFIFFGLFLVIGFGIGTLLQTAVDDLLGRSITVPDRIAGSALGVAQVGLVAIAIVAVFDRIVPTDRQPGVFSDSQLRPMLSRAAQRGLGALSPDVAATIDRFKHERKI